MSFVLEIRGNGSAISVEPVGVIDLEGARSLIEAVRNLAHRAQATLVEINLDRVLGLTKAAWRLLAASELPVEALASVGPSYGAMSPA